MKYILSIPLIVTYMPHNEKPGHSPHPTGQYIPDPVFVFQIERKWEMFKLPFSSPDSGFHFLYSESFEDTQTPA